MDICASPPNSPLEFDDTMRQLGTGYALHTGTTHRPFTHAPQDELTQAIRNMDLQNVINGSNPGSARAGVPRGLNPSPLVLAAQSVRPHDWSLTHRPAGYGSVYRDGGDFAHQYAGTASGLQGLLRPADEAYAYCFDRGDGEYTRLIPADMLPEMQDIPRRQRGAEGMTVLPVPSGRPPRGVQGATYPIHFKPRCCHVQTHRPADPIQNRIDTIVKSAPPPAVPKRNKIYCDKWVHEGTCAFTQQGCKFKHEMPLDRATQASLGLFHGLPAWWKKQQAELQRQREPASPSGSVASERGVSPLSGEARARPEGMSGGIMAVHTPGLERKAAGARRAHSPCAFGPIGAPSRGWGQQSGLAASRHNHEPRGCV